MPTRTASNSSPADAHRRARAQERVAVGMAFVVLVATAVAADVSIAGGISPSVSRIDVSADLCHGGDSIDHRSCPSGPPFLTRPPHHPTTADVLSYEELGPVLQGSS